MGSDSIPPKILSDESINRGLVCAHMHSIARTQKILTFMSQMGECQQQKQTQHAPSMKMECDYLNGWIKKKSQTGECQQQKHTQHAPSMKMEGDYLNGWIKKTVTYGEAPEIQLGNAEEEVWQHIQLSELICP